MCICLGGWVSPLNNFSHYTVESKYTKAGFHYVNRMGYFLTEVPWESGLEEVKLEDLTDDEEESEEEEGD